MAAVAQPLVLWIATWFASSGLNGVTSKQILVEVSCPFTLSACQLTIAFGCHACCTLLTEPIAVFQRKQNPRVHSLLVLSAVCFAVGITCFNGGFSVMHVSINETLRALEPLVSVFFASTCLRDPLLRLLSRYRLVALVPIVTGVYLSAISNAAFNMRGLMLAMLANLVFPVRSALVKRIQLVVPLDVMFHSTLYYAMLVQVRRPVHDDLMTRSFSFQWILAFLSIVDGRLHRPRPAFALHEAAFVTCNGVFFYLYHYCSFLVLTKTDMVSHAVANAVRRVSTILFSVWFFDMSLHPTNALGMAVACGGALAYARALHIERQKSHIDDASDKDNAADPRPARSKTRTLLGAKVQIV
ncbi:Aste57867_19539 [Aphanomyces stellatus]|uniref:Aste57867_19539 protein n=1 Tax=Aphanomyces stellatus TaxID=120398 RepID=A0A485LCR1_9STRA|nr:hypothetical protein As57867_019475 [Aphanomyces stellatus]VFT96246.1 Aste57867_19539 [Aphanomyces stellatus]